MGNLEDGMTGRFLILLVAPMMACGSPSPLPGLDDASRDYSRALAVFPGAEGFGTDTPAGRGGAVIVVDTLADDGAGSLRWALSQSGPRTIVFAVGGAIETRRNLEVHEPFVTIAGQTAPDPGITVSGAGLSVQTHDVLVQHLTLRPGDAADGPPFEDRDALQIIGREDGRLEVYNIVIDHVSLSWSTDEAFSTWYAGVRDVTVSHCLIAEALDRAGHPQGAHSKGFLIGDHTRRLAMLRNVLAHNDDRNPIFKGDTSALVVNNFIYDPGRWPVTFFDEEDAGPMLTSLIGNDFVYGPSSQADHATVLVGRSVNDGTRIYLDGNRGWDLSDSQRSLVSAESGHGAVFVDVPPVSVLPLTVTSVEALEPTLLSIAGSRPAARNPEDARVIETIRTRGGRIIDHVDEVRVAWPASSSRAPMLPDAPQSDADGNGYTRLEEWLHEQSVAVTRRL